MKRTAAGAAGLVGPGLCEEPLKRSLSTNPRRAMNVHVPRRGFARSCRVAGLLALSLLLVAGTGCASSGGSSDPDYDVDQGEIASRPLPNTRRATHHPDSLAHLSLVEEDGRIKFEHERSYRNMLIEWTSGVEGAPAAAFFQSHATLWSKELSLLSLEPERGVQNLSEDLARKMIAQRTAEYDSLLQIDVYVFARSTRTARIQNLRIDIGPRVYLEDAEGNTYRPAHIDADAPLEAFYHSRQTLYGRNAVLFDRLQDGKDLLNTDRLELHVGNARFIWTFPAPGEETADSDG